MAGGPGEVGGPPFRSDSEALWGVVLCWCRLDGRWCRVDGPRFKTEEE
jgi:hypothetical protein